jgi:hypothetical protein
MKLRRRIAIVIGLSAFALLAIPKWQAYQYERGRDAEVAKEMAASRGFADGHRAGEKLRNESDSVALAPERIHRLSESEFRMSGCTDMVNWRAGFEVAIER